jgi:hypothetical protein
MRLVALNDLYNRLEYGRVAVGSEFEARPSIAAALIRQGNARPAFQYETKILEALPAGVSASAESFRDVSLRDAESAGVAREFDPSVSGSDIPSARVVNRGKRGRRSLESAGE